MLAVPAGCVSVGERGGDDVGDGDAGVGDQGVEVEPPYPVVCWDRLVLLLLDEVRDHVELAPHDVPRIVDGELREECDAGVFRSVSSVVGKREVRVGCLGRGEGY